MRPHEIVNKYYAVHFAENETDLEVKQQDWISKGREKKKEEITVLRVKCNNETEQGSKEEEKSFNEMTKVRSNLCDNKRGCEKFIHERTRFPECLQYKIPQYVVWKKHS